MLVYELRIGNLVSKSLKSGNGRTLIDKVGPQDIVRIYENISHFNYHPILITEEWLEFRIKATKYNDNRFYLDLEKEGTFQLFWNIGDDYFICEFVVRSVHICYFNDHKYIHQLQNLYFALTQKELQLI